MGSRAIYILFCHIFPLKNLMNSIRWDGKFISPSFRSFHILFGFSRYYIMPNSMPFYPYAVKVAQPRKKEQTGQVQDTGTIPYINRIPAGQHEELIASPVC